MSAATFLGTGVAIVTPFLQNGEIEWDALKKLIHHLTEGKVDYLVVMGTTGENVALSKSEKQQIFSFVAQNNYANLPLVAGIGGNYTNDVLESLSSTGDNALPCFALIGYLLTVLLFLTPPL
jgi:4-hydroxy-tetrahydrodipicolinate synthase